MVEYLSGNRIQGSSTSGAIDGIGSAADLTLTGTTSYNTGLIGKCLYADFLGTETQQATPAGNFFSQARTNNDDFNFIHTSGEAWTINFWVKPDDWTAKDHTEQLIGNSTITPIDSGFVVKIDNREVDGVTPRKIATVFNNNGSAMYSAYNGTSGEMPNNTNWVMITVRCNGATTTNATALDICINGGTSNNDFTTPNGTCTRTSSTATARNASYGLMFGRNLLKRWGSTQDKADPFDGSFDEVSIWNRELTDDECVALYNDGDGEVTTTAVTNLSKLIAYWNFNDNVTNQASPTDEKTTLADATVTTDATPTYPTSGVLPTGSTTTDWTLTDTTISNSALNFNSAQASTQNDGVYDLGSALSNTKWVIRFKYTIANLTNGNQSNVNAFLGLFSGTGSYATNQNYMGLSYYTTSNTNYFWATASPSSNSTIWESSSTGRIYDGSVSATTYYVEIKRTSASTGEISIGTNSDFVTGRTTQTTFYGSISSSITGLRYIGIKNRSTVPTLGSAVFNGTISDIEVYDGITAVSTTSSAAPPVNTRYEEVDTRKIYRWADTTPVSWSATNQTWTQSGSSIALSGSTFTSTNASDNANPSDRVVSNEQTALSTNWICDFEYQTSSSNMNMFPLIIGNTNAKVTASNFDRVHIEGAGNASNFLRLKGMVGGSALNGDNSITGVSGTQYYGRIVKNALVVTLKIYGSSSDRENGTNQVSNTSTITFSSTPADFKFYQVSGRGDGGGGQMSWVTKNVEIYDGVTSPKSWKERGSA